MPRKTRCLTHRPPRQILPVFEHPCPSPTYLGGKVVVVFFTISKPNNTNTLPGFESPSARVHHGTTRNPSGRTKLTA